MNRDPRRLRIILALLVLTSFTLISLDYKAGKNGPLGSVRSVLTSIFDPVESGLSSVFRPVGRFVDDQVHAGRDGDKVRMLQKQVDQLQSRLQANADVTRQRQELAQLDTLAAGQSFKIIPAQVVAFGDASGFDDTVTINVGSADGIKADMTVIAGTTTGGGLVGRVVSGGITSHTATVAVIIDPDVAVGARLRRNAGTSNVGTANGRGFAPLTFTPTDPSVRPVKGDVIETYGTTVYAPGIPIGTVTSVGPTPGRTTLTASVTPFIDYTALDVVGVVVQPSSAAPAKPVLPTVTVTAHATTTVTLPPPGSSGSPGSSSTSPRSSSSP
jgi:rod shape-determining protein MreC